MMKGIITRIITPAREDMAGSMRPPDCLLRLRSAVFAIMVTLLSLSNTPVCGQEAYDPLDDFSKANSLYTDRNFQEAILIYERIVEFGFHSAELYYNLGNAYYRANNIPSAILNYERAALLSPSDEDIRANLVLARTKVRDRIEELPGFFLNRWWQQARVLLNAAQWASLSVATFLLTLALLTVFLISSSSRIKKLYFWLAVSVFMVSVSSFSLGLDQRNYSKNHNTAIIFSPVVSVKSSPDANSADLFVTHAGTKVRVEESIGEWRSVRLSDGNKGWLHKDAIEMI
jgi:tetratricopeptide (TPR) repeat protein